MIQLRALSGAMPGDAIIRFKPHSLDPKYNDTTLGMDITVIPAIIPAVLGIPLLANVNEGDSFSYEIKISTVPTEVVKVFVYLRVTLQLNLILWIRQRYR